MLRALAWLKVGRSECDDKVSSWPWFTFSELNALISSYSEFWALLAHSHSHLPRIAFGHMGAISPPLGQPVLTDNTQGVQKTSTLASNGTNSGALHCPELLVEEATSIF